MLVVVFWPGVRCGRPAAGWAARQLGGPAGYLGRPRGYAQAGIRLRIFRIGVPIGTRILDIRRRIDIGRPIPGIRPPTTRSATMVDDGMVFSAACATR